MSLNQEQVKSFVCYHKEILHWDWSQIANKLTTNTGTYQDSDKLRSLWRKMDSDKRKNYAKMYDNSAEVKIEEFDSQVHKYLLKNESVSLVSIADHFNTAPKTVVTSLERLKTNGYNISIEPPGDEYPDGKVALLREALSVELNKYIIKEKDDWIRFALVSDKHFGSKMQMLTSLHLAYEIMRKEGIHRAFDAGNILDGYNSYPGHEMEVSIHGATAQVDYLVANHPKVDGITTEFIQSSTCHEGKFYKTAGLIVGELIAAKRNDLIYLGMDQCDVLLENNRGRFAIRILHPTGGMAYSISYKPQRLAESWADMYLSGNDVVNIKDFKGMPSVVQLGHWHASAALPYFGSVIYHSGCFQRQTKYFIKKGLNPKIGFWMVEILPDGDGSIARIRQEWIPLKSIDIDYFT